MKIKKALQSVNFAFYSPIDFDECSSEQTNICSRYSSCENTVGAYRCKCLPGFMGNGTHCDDIDECNQVADPNRVFCNNTGKCENTIGFYRCECFKGFERTNNSNSCIGKI
jgi:hypothetical protein